MVKVLENRQTNRQMQLHYYMCLESLMQRKMQNQLFGNIWALNCMQPINSWLTMCHWRQCVIVNQEGEKEREESGRVEWLNEWTQFRQIWSVLYFMIKTVSFTFGRSKMINRIRLVVQKLFKVLWNYSKLTKEKLWLKCSQFTDILSMHILTPQPVWSWITDMSAFPNYPTFSLTSHPWLVFQDFQENAVWNAATPVYDTS